MGTLSALSVCSVVILAASTAGCGRGETATSAGEAKAAIRLVDVATEAGVRFTHTSGRSGRLYLPETAGSGCAVFDYDGDEKLDLFLVNGKALPGFTGKGPFLSALFRNKGDGTFEEVTRDAGLTREIYGMGCAVGDYDNDGDPDLFVSGLGPDVLYRNNGDGTFTDVTARAGVSHDDFSTSCAWFDYDRDGRLDLFIGSYCKWSPATNRICRGEYGEFMCSPEQYEGEPPRLYRNRGDGTFEDVTRKAGLYNPIGKNLGVLLLDLEEDGWPDLMLANDLEPNLLYRNNGDGTFSEIGVEAGVAYGPTGKARAGMGIDSADIEGSGREAIVIGNNTSEGLALFTAEAPLGSGGPPAFQDLAESAGLFRPSLSFLTFATVFADLDNDGLPDLLTANGHVNEHVERSGSGITYAQRPMLFRNLGGGRFADIAAEAGPALQTPSVARGIAAGDLDGDGDLDFLMSVCNGPAQLLRNDTPRRNHWLAVRARGRKSNRDGYGTRVLLEAGGRAQRGWIRSGGSYLAASDAVAWFGLGSATKVDRLTLRWPSGIVQTLTDLSVDRELLVEEAAD